MSHLAPKAWPLCRAVLGSRQDTLKQQKCIKYASAACTKQEVGSSTGRLFSYRLFPSSLSSIFVVWEGNFLVPGNWTVWAHARSLDLAAPGQLSPTADLSPGLGAGVGRLFRSRRNGRLSSAPDSEPDVNPAALQASFQLFRLLLLIKLSRHRDSWRMMR